MSVGPGKGQDVPDIVPVCTAQCPGATLVTTYNGVPLSTRLLANLSCGAVKGGVGCVWSMQVNVTIWNPIAQQWQPGGPFLVPPGPSLQSSPVSSKCGLVGLTQEFNPSWGTPTPITIWIVQAQVLSGGEILEQITQQILVSS